MKSKTMKFCCEDIKPIDWRFCPFCGMKFDESTYSDDDEDYESVDMFQSPIEKEGTRKMRRSVFDMKIGHRYCASCGADTTKVAITAGYGLVCPVCKLWWELEK